MTARSTHPWVSCYVRTTGRAGKAVLHVSSPQTASVEIEFNVVK